MDSGRRVHAGRELRRERRGEQRVAGPRRAGAERPVGDHHGGTRGEQRVQLLAEGGVDAQATGGELLRNPFNPWIFHLRAGYADEA